MYELKKDFLEMARQKSFVCNYEVTLETPVIIKGDTKIQYLCTLFSGELLKKF